MQFAKVGLLPFGVRVECEYVLNFVTPNNAAKVAAIARPPSQVHGETALAPGKAAKVAHQRPVRRILNCRRDPVLADSHVFIYNAMSLT
jgi:hypothetical protein